jgi:hypothetical protein
VVREELIVPILDLEVPEILILLVVASVSRIPTFVRFHRTCVPCVLTSAYILLVTLQMN